MNSRTTLYSVPQKVRQHLTRKLELDQLYLFYDSLHSDMNVQSKCVFLLHSLCLMCRVYIITFPLLFCNTKLLQARLRIIFMYLTKFPFVMQRKQVFFISSIFSPTCMRIIWLRDWFFNQMKWILREFVQAMRLPMIPISIVHEKW